MRKREMTARLCIVAVILLGSTAFLHGMSHGEAVVARQPLRELPYVLGNWTGQEVPIEQRLVLAASVSDYTNRLYLDSSNQPVYLYIGYYASQRTGDTIHSPKNCLPGSGWEPIHQGYAKITLSDGQPIVVNDYVIQMGIQKDLVFYWYQGRGRVIASEYWGKFWMISDAITRNRTDGALVRLITPIESDKDAANAQARLVNFTRILFPHLDTFIPN
jgi:EpsI family protein